MFVWQMILLSACPWKTLLYERTSLVYNVPFCEVAIQRYLHEAEVVEKFKTKQEGMNVLYKCEDVRDHIDELWELAGPQDSWVRAGRQR